jgi:hypothetical protein
MNIAVRTRESSERAANAGQVALVAPRENHPVAYTLEPEPIAIDPRPCVCGYTIDQHLRVDTPEGPEFYCRDIEADEFGGADDLVRQWELADPRDRWKHTGEPPPPEIGIPVSTTRPSYRTPQSTIDAFWYVVRLEDADHLKRWLAQHPRDVVTLQKLWDGKHARI